MEALTRSLFLYLSKNALLNHLAKKHGRRWAAGKMIGGTDFQSSIPCIRHLNHAGLSVTVDHLGEFVDTKEIAEERTKECIQTIRMIHREQLDSHVSLKLTSLGLDIHRDLVEANMARILEAAEEHQVMVTIDMEDVPRCQATLDLFKQFKRSHRYVSTVLQAYLYRTASDLDDLNTLKPFIRLVKGAYKESRKHAFPNKQDVDDNYKKLIVKSLQNGNYTAVASHDDQMIEFTKTFTKEHRIPTEQFEFQMLYGMRTRTQLDLVKQGYKVRVYVPYGLEWYGYFMRRLAERPANIAFVFKNFLKK
ncbi:proline dehydrogenase family protein [Bacillus xiapuensis]|uniref:proline dehydrogenase family protein n=1 Tax=Bacillus xiapuensis TaxID=2014075 RepID=UPI000C243930|nr:proline dehydrogenase family protein [Bacillus xiapuensis]